MNWTFIGTYSWNLISFNQTQWFLLLLASTRTIQFNSELLQLKSNNHVLCTFFRSYIKRTFRAQSQPLHWCSLVLYIQMKYINHDHVYHNDQIILWVYSFCFAVFDYFCLAIEWLWNYSWSLLIISPLTATTIAWGVK